LGKYLQAEHEIDAARQRASRLVEASGGEKGFNDTNYIFLSFVTRYMPTGVVGLMIAVIILAAISSASGEINSLATVTVVDFYKRYWRREASDRHFLNASRWATLFWGAYCVGFAFFGGRLGSLIVAVNMIGCLLIGIVAGSIEKQVLVSPMLRLAIIVGFLGGFTTFSSFALEGYALAHTHDWLAAGGYIVLTNVIGLGAVWAGHRLVA